jgi:hypothetical protein
MRSILLVLLRVMPLALALNINFAPFDSISLILPSTQELERRDNGTCGPRPLGSGPVPSPDTAYAFLNSPEFESLAKNATTPSEYTLAFQNLHASSSTSEFLGYISLNSYDTNTCALNCNHKTSCTSINVFFERDSTLTVGPDCPNPASTTVIKCVFWGAPVSKDNTKNSGYTDNNFIVAIAGSNGYIKRDEASGGSTG